MDFNIEDGIRFVTKNKNSLKHWNSFYTFSVLKKLKPSIVSIALRQFVFTVCIPSLDIAGIKVSAGGLGVVDGQTPSALPATMAAPSAVLSIINGRICNKPYFCYPRMK